MKTHIFLRNFIICATLILFQATSGVQSFAFSISDEREVGEKLLYSVRTAFVLKDDPDLTQYIAKLGQSVLEVAGIQYFDYHFFIIDDKEFNAFAAPSGLIFFNSGLIKVMNSEDELVSVLAHEIGHIDKRHLASSVEKGTYSGIATLGLALAAIAFGGTTAPVLLTGAIAAGQSVNLHFSRQNEEEADRLAYDWLKKLGRDPEAMVKMLESMRKISRYRSEKLPQYLLTHPDPDARLNYIQSLIDSDVGATHVRNPKEDFEFLRFKYRIMAETEDGENLKTYLATILADGKASKFAQIMATYGLSQVAKVENDFPKSIEYLQQVIAFFTKNNLLQIDKGVLEFQAGNLAQAESDFRSGLHNDNNNLYAMFYLGRLLNRSGKSQEAEELFYKVSRQLPEYAPVYFELGQISSSKNQNGLTAYYLGKYDLFNGKLKLADESFKNALRDSQLPEKEKEETKSLIKKIEQLKK